jgi:hypothetical protein
MERPIRTPATERPWQGRIQTGIPIGGILSVGAILCQLERRTLRIKRFQQKRDPDADQNERPKPTRVDVGHAHSREQEHDAVDQK